MTSIWGKAKKGFNRRIHGQQSTVNRRQSAVHGRWSALLAFFSIAGLLFIALIGHAQKPIEEYPFIRTDLNVLEFYGDTSKFTKFFSKLDEMVLKGEGQINIMHIGGSHVQGGVLTHAIRQHFNALVPGANGARGFFFPYELAKTNNPYNYIVKNTGSWEGFRIAVDDHQSRWGVSGITGRTSDANAEVTVYSRSADEPFRFTKARIFYHMDSTSYVPVWRGKTDHVTRFDSQANYVEFRFDKARDTLVFGFEKRHPMQRRILIQGIQLLDDQPGITVNAIGVNGASTDDYMRPQNFVEQLRTFSPDLVLFGIGINDSHMLEYVFSRERFEGHYEDVIAQIKKVNPNVAFLFLVNNDSYFRGAPNPNVVQIARGMRNLATRHGGAVWDFFSIMGGMDSIRLWEDAGLARPDRIHMTREGYQVQGDLLFKAIKTAYGNYLYRQYQQP
jgi:lysophospholipase L1-like esterase